MKRLILTLIIILSASTAMFASQAPSANVDDIFSEFSSAKDADFVNVNPVMMWLGKQFIDDDPDAQIVKKIKSVRVLDLEKCNSSTKSKFKQQVNRISTKGYEEMVRMNDHGEKVLIFAKIKEETIHQMIIVCVSDGDCALVEVNGKFTMDDIAGVVKSQTPKKHGRR